MTNENVSNHGFKLWQVIVAFVVGGAIVGSGFMISGEKGKGFMFRFSDTSGSNVDPAKAEVYADRRDVAITRCDLAKLLVENLDLTYESLDLGPTPGGAIFGFPGFDDVSVDHPCRSYVDLVTGGAHPIMRGFADGTFRPDGSLTRAETIKYITNGFGLSENLDHVNQFSDLSTHWVQGFASTAYHWGLLAKNRKACYPKEFFPDGNAKKNWVKMVIKNAKAPYAID